MKPRPTTDVHSQPLFLCVYGPSGVGKTSLAKTLEGRTLVLDAESGLAVLGDPNIDYISLAIDEKGEFVPEEKRLERMKEFMTYTRTPECRAKYKNIVIDSITEIGENLNKRMATLHANDNFKRWGEYKNALLDFLKFFRDTGSYTTLFIALEARLDDEAENSSKYVPALAGAKAQAALMPVFDAVLRMRADKDGKRHFVCRQTAKTDVKVRHKNSHRIEEIEPAHIGEFITKLTRKEAPAVAGAK